MFALRNTEPSWGNDNLVERGLEIGKALAASSSLLELSQMKVGDKLSVAVLQSSTGSLPDGDGIFQP
jgi:hypothetical protein